MKIAVLAGGTSTERNVSLTTSLNVFKALKKLGHKVVLIDVFYGTGEKHCSCYGKEKSSVVDIASANGFFDADIDVDKEVEELRKLNDETGRRASEREKDRISFFGEGVLEICKEADIVFMGLHGENGENGKIQAVFDLLGIRYTGPGYLSSAISMDKAITKKILVPEGVPMPAGEILIRGKDINEEKLPLPCVVKPACGGSSVGVAIARTAEERNAAIKEAFELEEKVLVEQFVEGREFSVGVIEGQALPVVEIIPKGGVYDYKHKYDPDGAKEICPAEIPEDVAAKMQEYAALACKEAEIDTYSRVDVLLDKDGIMYCLEINTLPGLTPTSLLPKEAAALGKSYEDLVQWLIDVSMKKYVTI